MYSPYYYYYIYVVDFNLYVCVRVCVFFFSLSKFLRKCGENLFNWHQKVKANQK